MATTDTATPGQALLALYGALDHAVTSTGDPEIEATVERYLPGSTGANAGWYDELLGFLADRSRLSADEVEQAPAAPDLTRALSILQSHRSMTSDADAQSLTPTQLSQMVYAIGALSHLPAWYLPTGWEEQFAATLAVAARAVPLTAGVTGAPGEDDLLTVLRQRFRTRDDYLAVKQYAAQRGLLEGDVVDVALCQARARLVRGQICVVLTTEFPSPQVSLYDLRNVIDPLNWAQCLPYFCRMDPQGLRPDGWSQVLEHFSTTCSIAGTPQLVTPLKYFKGEGVTAAAQPTAWVDFAIDDHPPAGGHGDGRVVVDEGFIRMTSTGDDATKPGVRVRTRKVVGFRNLGYVAAARFACAMRYGDVGVQMLIGGVAKRKQSPTGWTDWTTSTPGGSPPSPTPPGPPTPPERNDTGRRAVTLALDMVNDCIDDMSAKSAAIAAKWATGAVPVAETMTYTVDVANRLATDPWRYLNRLRGPQQGGDR